MQLGKAFSSYLQNPIIGKKLTMDYGNHPSE